MQAKTSTLHARSIRCFIFPSFECDLSGAHLVKISGSSSSWSFARTERSGCGLSGFFANINGTNRNASSPATVA
eukprot:m.30449 g.30449  ORF g.30449 m.30449 type:complete len:74 (-) comp41127_c1_seq1:562-783(-)